VFLIVIPLMPRGAALLYAPTMFILGALATGFVVTVRAITADVGDDLRLQGGRDLIGLLYAVTSATTKAAGALAIFVSYALLNTVNFDVRPGAINSADQIHSLELIFITGPIVFVMLGGACFFGYRLTPERHAEIRRQLDERDALIASAGALESLTADGELAAAGRAS
jgi:Na+/melibiose symporter-like transporter